MCFPKIEIVDSSEVIDGEQLLIELANFEFELEKKVRAKDTVYSSMVDISLITSAAAFTRVCWLQEIEKLSTSITCALSDSGVWAN